MVTTLTEPQFRFLQGRVERNDTKGGNVKSLSGLKVHRTEKTVFVPLPPEAWRPVGPGGCQCKTCREDGGTKGSEVAFWDTLCVEKDKPAKEHSDTTWVVHYPELHAKEVREKARYDFGVVQARVSRDAEKLLEERAAERTARLVADGFEPVSAEQARRNLESAVSVDPG